PGQRMRRQVLTLKKTTLGQKETELEELNAREDSLLGSPNGSFFSVNTTTTSAQEKTPEKGKLTEAAGYHTPQSMNTVKRSEQVVAREAEAQRSADWSERVAKDSARLARRKAEVDRSHERSEGEEYDRKLMLSRRNKTPLLKPLSPDNSSGGGRPSTSGPAAQGSGFGSGGKENQNYGARPKQGSQFIQAASAAPR
ncbi:MAG: hypothetical protein GY823_14325, partial [Flavobacteriaceae bacterium]|nr:hypothetical protein [Flavobacteriaceae bacterium]